MYLGLDLGTTNIKALVVDDAGRVTARGSAPVELLHTADHGVEQDIEQIWSATLGAVAAATAGCDGTAIGAIGVSSQGGALQLLDQRDRPLGHVVSWLDGRGRPFDEELTARLGQGWFAQRVGHAGSGTTIGQVLRLRAAGALGQGFHVGYVGDVIVSRLCGRRAHDATSLSLAMLYNPRLRAADPDVLRLLDLQVRQFPLLLPARNVAGPLQGHVAERTGLPAGIPVSPGVHDQYASALAANVLAAGDVMVGTGTAWVLLAVCEDLPSGPVADAFLCTHLMEGRFGQILSLRNGGSAVSWAAGLAGLNDPSGEKLDELLAAAPPGCDGLTFWPFLAGAGVRLPSQTAGRLNGLRLSHGAPHLLRAVVEGLACELARYCDYLRGAGQPIGRLVLCGGAARGQVTPGIVADVTGLPVDCLVEPDTSAFGAAILARGLLEPRAPLEDIARQMAPTARAVWCGPNRDAYAALFCRYVDSLPAPAASN